MSAVDLYLDRLQQIAHGWERVALRRRQELPVGQKRIRFLERMIQAHQNNAGPDIAYARELEPIA